MIRRVGVAVAEGELRTALVERIGSRVRVRGVHRTHIAGARTLDDAIRDAAEVLAPGRRAEVGVALSPRDAWLKLLALPPLPPADRTRLVEMEAERYFPVRGEAVLADASSEGPVAAARADAVEALVGRVEETLGRVVGVEPQARAAVRAWAALQPALGRGVFATVTRTGGWWEVSVARGGTLLGHARLLGAEPEAVADALASAVQQGGVLPRVLIGVDPAEEEWLASRLAGAIEARLPGTVAEACGELAPGVPAEFAAAIGAALAPAGGLLPASHRERLSASGRRRTTAWVGAAALAFLLFLGAGPWREARRAKALEAEAAALAPRADAAAELLERVRRSTATIRFTDSLDAARPRWLDALEELGRRLPPGAYLTEFQADAEKQTVEIRGYAGRASAIVPLLEQSPRFSGVESVEPVTRRTVGSVELENFAIRMQVAP